MQELFSWDFNHKTHQSLKVTTEILLHLKKIDRMIAKAAPAWPIEKINKIDLSILRLAAYELTLDNQAPPKVVVDEAIELAKEFGSESSPGFVNGVLGKLIIDNNITT